MQQAMLCTEDFCESDAATFHQKKKKKWLCQVTSVHVQQ